MDSSVLKKSQKSHKRAIRVRKRLRGSSLRPRLCLVKSNAHLQAQLVDDESGKTIASAATFSKEFRQAGFSKKNKENAIKLGQKLASIAKEKNVETVVFDRGSSKYHGVVAAFADAAREAGLQF